MGYGLPAAIGAYYADKDRVIINLSGDGSFQMNIQELGVLSAHRIPIKIVIFNNDSLGMIKQFQDYYLDGRYASSIDMNGKGFDNPNFETLATAYGLGYFSFPDDDMSEDIIRRFIECEGAALLEIRIDSRCHVHPIRVGKTSRWFDKDVDNI